jgi:hypothetical protein
MYVEEFDDPLVGAPISNELKPGIDLDRYIQSTGRLGHAGNFEVAELLMTSGMTDSAKERHLQSTLVSENMNMWLCFAHRSNVVSRSDAMG